MSVVDSPIITHAMEPTIASKRYRAFVWTFNNYTPDSIDFFDGLVRKGKAKYVVFGEEVGSVKQTPHLQGFVYFKNPRTTGSVCKEFKCWARPSVCIKKAREYCMKDGHYHEHGEPPLTQEQKGERGAEFWQEQLTHARNGNFDEISPDLLFRDIRTIIFHRDLYLRSAVLEDTVKSNVWLYGPSGSGKSRKARTGYYEAHETYFKNCNKWWCGFQPQVHKLAVIDDFDKAHHVLCYHLKIWGDRYAFNAETKGSSFLIRPEMIVVTSNWHPSEIWGDSQNLEPILRRFKVEYIGPPQSAEPSTSTNTQFED